MLFAHLCMVNSSLWGWMYPVRVSCWHIICVLI
uniref:Uncharacterized protein n=1 Tax=Rhizophora mucronata TaxID=61149 RepID=A0A2P2Q464_RHIMU